jgi:hypothetical protein
MFLVLIHFVYISSSAQKKFNATKNSNYEIFTVIKSEVILWRVKYFIACHFVIIYSY